MQAQQKIHTADSSSACLRTDRTSWHVIRGSRNIRRKALYRKWQRIYDRSAAGMISFAVLFFLVWLAISMLSPQDHFLPGLVLLLILSAEAASVTAHLISDFILQRLRP